MDFSTSDADFKVLFGSTKAATIYHPLRQLCYIVRISLSIVARRSLDDISELLFAAINDGVQSFQVAYSEVLVDVKENGIRTLSNLGIATAKESAHEVRAGNSKPTCLYVLTDEYGRIINTLIAQREPLKSDQTTNEVLGPFIQYFLTLKRMSEGVPFLYLRTVTCGIFPLALGELSGWTHSPEFSRMLDLSKTDILRALKEVIPANNEDGLTQTQQDNLFEPMRRLYNGYMFPGMDEDVDAVFNPALCRAFFFELETDKICCRWMLEAAAVKGGPLPVASLSSSTTPPRLSESLLRLLLSQPSLAAGIAQDLVESDELMVPKEDINARLTVRDLIESGPSIGTLRAYCCTTSVFLGLCVSG